MCTLWQRFRRESASSDGFTLAELVISMAVLLFVLTGVLGSVQFAAVSAQQSSVRQGAAQLANERIEYARDIPYQALGTKNADGTFGDPAGVLPVAGESITTTSGAYTVAYEVWWERKVDPDPAARTVMFKKIKVNVRWDKPRSGTVSVESAIYGVDTDAVVGDVQVYAQDVDSLEAVPGVVVGLSPISGPVRAVTTGEDGYSLFGQVPFGKINDLTAAKSGYMFDAAQVAAAAYDVSPNVVNTWAVSLQKPKNATIHVQSGTGVAVAGASVTLTNQERGLSYGPFTTDSAGNTPPIDNLWNAMAAGYTATATYSGNSANSAFLIENADTAVTSTIVLYLEAPITVTVLNSTDNQGLGGVTVGMTGPVNPVEDGSLTSSSGTKVYIVKRSGTYTITASKTGFVSQTVTFVVDLSNPTNPDPIILVAIVPRVKLRVTVTDVFDGQILQGRSVVVKNSSNVTVGLGTTDSNGQIPLIDITASGPYTVNVAAKDNYQAFSGTTTIDINGPDPVGYTAGTVTGRITVRIRTSGGGVPANPTSYRVRLKDPSGTIIPTGSRTYYNFDSSGNFTFAPLATGTYTYGVRISNSWPNPYWSAATIVTGVSTPYVVTKTVN